MTSSKLRMHIGKAPLSGAALAGACMLTLSACTGPAGSEQTAGRQLYVEHCAACHGANLEGQPNWRERLPNGRLPAPPHDATGHTWHHSDEQLFEITKHGLEALVPDYKSDMPGFGDKLSDEEIRAVLDYIKSTWPPREREYQAARS